MNIFAWYGYMFCWICVVIKFCWYLCIFSSDLNWYSFPKFLETFTICNFPPNVRNLFFSSKIGLFHVNWKIGHFRKKNWFFFGGGGTIRGRGECTTIVALDDGSRSRIETCDVCCCSIRSRATERLQSEVDASVPRQLPEVADDDFVSGRWFWGVSAVGEFFVNFWAILTSVTFW